MGRGAHSGINDNEDRWSTWHIWSTLIFNIRTASYGNNVPSIQCLFISCTFHIHFIKLHPSFLFHKDHKILSLFLNALILAKRACCGGHMVINHVYNPAHFFYSKTSTSVITLLSPELFWTIIHNAHNFSVFQNTINYTNFIFKLF